MTSLHRRHQPTIGAEADELRAELRAVAISAQVALGTGDTARAFAAIHRVSQLNARIDALNREYRPPTDLEIPQPA